MICRGFEYFDSEWERLLGKFQLHLKVKEILGLEQMVRMIHHHHLQMKIMIRKKKVLKMMKY
jgi:hypothetical protein